MKKNKFQKHRENLAIGIAGGFVSGGCLLTYQILLPLLGIIFSIISSVIVAFIIWKLALRMILKFNK